MAVYKTSLQISIPELVGYKTSLFKTFTPEWLLIRPYGDFVSGVITSPPVRRFHSINHFNNRFQTFEFLSYRTAKL